MKTMRRMYLIVLCCILGCTSINASHILNDVPDPVSFTPPVPEEFVLSNGIKVFFLRDTELPLIHGTLYLRGGTLWETPRTTGSFAALGSLMRLGGAGKRSADELDRALEEMSAGVSTSFGGEYGTASFGCLSGDLQKVLEIYSDVLLRPRFQEDRISLWKSQMMEGIRRRKDSPDSVAPIAFNQLLFGDSPLGRVMTSSVVRRIRARSLKDLHKRFVRPDGALLAISGNIEKEKLKKLLENSLAAWKPVGSVHTPPKIEFSSATPGIYFLKMPFTQATVLFGHRGVSRLSKDYIEIEGFNSIFGSDGDFSSYLAKEVRSDRGLAYTVVGGIYPGFPIGKNMIALQTKSSTTGEAIDASLAVLERMRSGLIPQNDVEDAKRAITNSYIFKFDTIDGLVQRAAVLSLLNYPKTYDDTYTRLIRELSGSAIQAVAQKRWNLPSLIVLVAGDDNAYRSLKQGIASGPAYLRELPIREVYFDEALKLQ